MSKKDKAQKEIKETNKKLNEVDTVELLNQLSENIKIGLENIDKEINKNDKLKTLINVSEDLEILDVKKTIDDANLKLFESKEKMTLHLNYLSDIISEYKENKLSTQSMDRLLLILLRK